MTKDNTITCKELEEYQDRRYNRHRSLGLTPQEAIKAVADDVNRFKAYLAKMDKQQLSIFM